MDIRYYAVTDHGRSRLRGQNLEEARQEVAAGYFPERTKRIVRETREEFSPR